MSSRKIHFLAAAVLLALPSTAMANVGTPLMFALPFHLVIGNLIIAFFEAYLLARFFCFMKIKYIGLMILANYFSAWFGGVVILNVLRMVLPFNFNNAWAFYWLCMVAAYVLTLVLEYPFVAYAFRKENMNMKKACYGNLIIQSISYLLLFGFYWSVSGTSLYSGKEIVKLESMPLPEQVWMYYISAEDGDIYRGELVDGRWKKFHDLDSTDWNDRLIGMKDLDNADQWNLVARLQKAGEDNENLVIIQEEFASLSVSNRTGFHRIEESWLNFRDVPKLGDAEKSDWTFHGGFWPVEGLRGRKRKSKKDVHIAFETPFKSWVIRNSIHLPGDFVLFQLGENQICLLDAENGMVALVARGRGPLVAVDPSGIE